MSVEATLTDRIQELKKKIRQEEYLRVAILEIASLLTESLDKSHFLFHERT